jgi:hypothetical protein
LDAALSTSWIELLDEDRLSDLTLVDCVSATGVDDGEVRNANEAEDNAEVGAFEVVRLVHGVGDDDFVGGEQLGDEFVGDLEGGLVVGGVLVGSGVGASDPR